MFYSVKVKPENNNKDIYEAIHLLGYTVKFKASKTHPRHSTQNTKPHNALTASDTAIQKTSATEKRDASSVQKDIRLLTAHARLNSRTSNMSCAKATTQPIIKTTRSTKT